MSDNSSMKTTDSWSIWQILKYVFLPKPKGSPKAGNKERIVRLVIATFFAFFTYIVYSGKSLFYGDKALPNCDQLELARSVGKIVNNLPGVKENSVQYVSLEEINELGYNEEADIRSCSAILVTTAGEDNILYSVRWSDKNKGQFRTEARIVE